MRISVLMFSLLGLVASSFSLAAGDRGTPEEAKALVKKAITFYKTNGKDKTMTALNDAKGAFVDRDLYVFVHDDKGIYYAIAPKPNFIGKDMTGVKDANGKLIVKEQIDALKTSNSMWQEYHWQNPVNQKIEPKKTYCEKHENLHFCSGAYTS